MTMNTEMALLVKMLGGPAVLRSAPSNRLELVGLIRGGLPYESLTSVIANLNVSTEQVAEVLDLPRRTLARRKEGKLSATESERVARLARVASRAKDVFEDNAKAMRWLTKPNRALGGNVPFSLLDTDVGAQAVEEELLRIEHGFFA